MAYQSLGTVAAHTGISWNVEQFKGITWNTMVSWSVCLGSSLIMLEHHGTSRNPMNNYDVSWSALEVREYTGVLLNIEEYAGMPYVMISRAAESPDTTLGRSSTTLGIFLYRRKGASAPKPRSVCVGSALNILEYTENRRISRNIMERHEKSRCHGLPWKLTEYTGISLNIEEHDGMAYVVISCIAESPITPLGLASTTLGIFLYRRRGASAPEPPWPQK